MIRWGVQRFVVGCLPPILILPSRKDSIFSFDTLKANLDTNCLGLRWGVNSCRGDRSLEDVSAQRLYNCDPCFVKNNTEGAFRLVASDGFNKPELKVNRVVEFEHLNSASFSTCSPVEIESGIYLFMAAGILLVSVMAVKLQSLS
ncbi:hypothetical protein IHE45_06G035300 [Dioscorea alata]|uniref:Uncharacterized protein n=1 Tax=Dioscorea alata TaxID=55571 RepID=A0ACB7VWI1_DIOAL|nr:hypothetical protein IHE45_06G035300 [Dioscorea alata]